MYLSDSYQKGKNNNTNQPAMATVLQTVKISWGVIEGELKFYNCCCRNIKIPARTTT